MKVGKRYELWRKCDSTVRDPDDDGFEKDDYIYVLIDADRKTNERKPFAKMVFGTWQNCYSTGRPCDETVIAFVHIGKAERCPTLDELLCLEVDDQFQEFGRQCYCLTVNSWCYETGLVTRPTLLGVTWFVSVVYAAGKVETSDHPDKASAATNAVTRAADLTASGAKGVHCKVIRMTL